MPTCQVNGDTNFKITALYLSVAYLSTYQLSFHYQLPIINTNETVTNISY